MAGWHNVVINMVFLAKYLKHIKRLCEEKNVPIEYFDLKKYNVCGIIKDVADL